jgi:hypothetical protein
MPSLNRTQVEPELGRGIFAPAAFMRVDHSWLHRGCQHGNKPLRGCSQHYLRITHSGDSTRQDDGHGKEGASVQCLAKDLSAYQDMLESSGLMSVGIVRHHLRQRFPAVL